MGWLLAEDTDGCVTGWREPDECNTACWGDGCHQERLSKPSIPWLVKLCFEKELSHRHLHTLHL